MAKKARTPKPPRPSGGAPRPVQAPQRRTGPSRTAKAPSRAGERRWFWPLAAVAVALAIVGVVLGIVLTRSSGTSGSAGTYSPWPPHTEDLAARLPSIGLSALSREQLAYHIHQHLDLYVNGRHVKVPAYIGFGGNSTKRNFKFITELHTHTDDGVIHVESAQQKGYTLGQLFAEWSVGLTKKCMGNLPAGCKSLKWYVNGKQQKGDPANLVLQPHQEIAIVVGKPPAKIPSTYDFPAGE
jgi:hypothetical protein